MTTKNPILSRILTATAKNKLNWCEQIHDLGSSFCCRSNGMFLSFMHIISNILPLNIPSVSTLTLYPDSTDPNNLYSENVLASVTLSDEESDALSSIIRESIEYRKSQEPSILFHDFLK